MLSFIVQVIARAVGLILRLKLPLLSILGRQNKVSVILGIGSMTTTAPCSNCPFRSDIDFHLSAEKVQSILAALEQDGDFTCHNTTTATGGWFSLGKACVGGALFLEHVLEGGCRANRAFRMREGCFKEFRLAELDRTVPVFTDAASFLAARTS